MHILYYTQLKSISPNNVTLHFLFIQIHQYHGCQLPDFSLRSQTFCYTADISTTFLYMLKTKTFLHILTKPTASTQNSKLLTLFCKKISVTSDKNGKSAPPSWTLCLGRPMACGNAYVKHLAKFPDFFETQCWQPCPICQPNPCHS